MGIFNRFAKVNPVGQVGGLWGEFKAFAFKGNVIDLAVGVIIGAAFGKIVDSLVKHIIMPLIGAILPGKEGYQGWTVELGGSQVAYGQFLGEVVNFLIVAAALFIFLVKFLGFIMKAKAKETPPPTKAEVLLTEIRDLLKANAAPASPPAA